MSGETRQHADAVTGARVRGRRVGRGQLQGPPDVYLVERIDELFRHHADDGMCPTSENDAPADRCGIGGELRAPERVRQNDNGLAQVIGVERAAIRGRDAKKRQQSGRDVGHVHPLGRAELGERQVCAIGRFDRCQRSCSLAPGLEGAVRH